ncbi:TRAP-type mannitol/chloroaromatic compound transport system substrate-binding protein [Litorimonas taeanensis]|uniref:TRAP-type mannitol/chloroaromatic compound transport system substrate-binding protein n=1 Tax=Litorimonas taeanensis TaxID=568099 RepID=A0A420WKB0_9PROT|nr:TRAP transporter substrate-binding protein [Litorimonas taeanensis]RKQ71440.1 TRAP-type mannitol/chloroaromatic compound transport system substrate-binding protein [Litorimonas taeanensis]
MKRRDILLGSGAVAIGAGTLGALTKTTSPKPESSSNKSALASPSLSKNRRQLRLATSWPKDFPGLGIMPVNLAKAVYDMTDGRLDIKVYAAGELVGALECFGATSTGAADMYHAAEYYWQGKSKGFNFFTAVPMGMTATEIMGWIDHGGGQELWDDLSGQFNIQAFQAGNSGHQTGGWFKKEIQSIEDFKGLKIRMPGLGGDIIRELGGAAVNLPGGEIYQALQSGAIDATEWVGPWNDLAFGFYREAPYYYAPGFHEPGASLSLGINKDVWNSFTPSDQAIIRYACRSVNDISLGEYNFRNAVALETLKSEHGIEPRILPDNVLATIGAASEDVLSGLAQADRKTANIYQSFVKNLKLQRAWTELGDGAFIRARTLAQGTK